MKVNWKGVFPALTTQFKPDQALDLPATAKHLETLIQAGIQGVVLLGTVGENTALAYEEIGRSRDPHTFPHGGALHRIAHHDLQQPGLLQRRRAG